jgi:hypothetical protein
MIKSRSIILSVALAFGSLCAQAATAGVTFLFSNGQTASFAFASKPVVAVNDGSLTVSSSKASPVSYQFADVQRFYFEDDVVDTGIAQTETVASAQHPVFDYVDGVLTVKNLSAGERLVVATVNGSAVKTVKADNVGNASVDLGSEPAGVYVVSTGNGVSFKLLKK